MCQLLEEKIHQSQGVPKNDKERPEALTLFWNRNINYLLHPVNTRAFSEYSATLFLLTFWFTVYLDLVPSGYLLSICYAFLSLILLFSLSFWFLSSCLSVPHSFFAFSAGLKVMLSVLFFQSFLFDFYHAYLTDGIPSYPCFYHIPKFTRTLGCLSSYHPFTASMPFLSNNSWVDIVSF